MLLHNTLIFTYAAKRMYKYVLSCFNFSFALSEKEVKPLIGDMTLEKAVKNKRLFIVNHEFLNGLHCTGGRKVLNGQCTWSDINATV